MYCTFGGSNCISTGVVGLKHSMGSGKVQCRLTRGGEGDGADGVGDEVDGRTAVTGLAEKEDASIKQMKLM